MPVTINNEIVIAVSPETLFNYVTQPWLWHEWHPSSRSARSEHSVLAEGDGFDEVIEVQPLAPLPSRLRKSTRYVVAESKPFGSWEVKGKMQDGWLRIRYDFSEVPGTPGVTHFHRTLEFEVSGFNRLLLPFLERKMAKISPLAMANLKQRMESSS